MQLIAGSSRYGENLSVHPFHPRPYREGEGRTLPLRRCSLRTLPHLLGQRKKKRLVIATDPEWNIMLVRSLRSHRAVSVPP